MTQSILDSVKKYVGLDPSYTAFDTDILMHINSAFSTLEQVGVGPAGGFMIEDSVPTWDAFLGTDKRLNNVKLYVFLEVRLIFDPPQTGYLVEAFQKKRDEELWRISVTRENDHWTSPVSTIDEEDEMVLDGGGA